MGDQTGEELGMLCTGIFDFDGVRSDNLRFKKGDVITIIEMNEHGWWKGVNPDGEVGIFPYNYVEQIKPAVNKQTVLRALADLDGPFEGALTFSEGDLLVKIKPVNEDWSEGKLMNTGEQGVYPNNYFEEDEIDEEDESAFEMQERIASYRAEEQERLAREEAEARAEIERLERERAETERRLREEEQRKAEERERALEEHRLLREQEAAQRKAEEEKLKRKTAILEAQQEADRMREELRLLKEKLAEEERAREATKAKMEREAQLARERTAEAEAEAERARAEAAALRKQQEQMDAFKSEAVKKKVDAENQVYQDKWRASMAFNTGLGTKDLPALPERESITAVYSNQPNVVVGDSKPPVAEFSQTPAYADPKLHKAEPKKKNNFLIQPVYVQDESDKQEVLDVAKQNFSKLTAGPQDKVPRTLPRDKDTKQEELEDPPTPLPSYEDVVGRDFRGRRKNKPKIPSKFARLGGGDGCTGCGKSVAFGPERLKALNTTWHKECFKCTKCSKVLRFGTHVETQGKPYCSGCHKEVTGISKYVR